MGCGASTVIPPAPTESRGSKVEPGLVNGHVSSHATAPTPVKQSSFNLTSSMWHNSVGPAPPHDSVPAKSRQSDGTHEISEVGDILKVKRLVRSKLSSIEESVIPDSKDATTQTGRVQCPKLTSHAVQTDQQLFPEDELEEILMTNSEADEEQDGDFKSSDAYASEDDDCDEGLSSYLRTLSHQTDAWTQSRSWTCSRSTQTKHSFATISWRSRPSKSSNTSINTIGEGYDEAKRSHPLTSHRDAGLMEETLTDPGIQTPTSLSLLPAPSTAGKKVAGCYQREVSVQTDWERKRSAGSATASPESWSEPKPRPPPTRKKDVIPSTHIFRDIDTRVNENVTNELFRVRAIFLWTALNIRLEYRGRSEGPCDVLVERAGTNSDYCHLFETMCRSQGISAKTIRGFAKGHDYRPGYEFIPGGDEMHEWNAVYVLGCWRLVDTTFASGFIDASGNFVAKLNEHYFLPDPEVLIWSHWPHGSDSARWQLVQKPVTLQEFNSMPRVTCQFFENSMQIRSKQAHPYTFHVQTEVQLSAHEAMRFKYKLFPADQAENSSLNHFVFCQLKENRLLGSFTVTPPLETRYFLKVYAKAEREMLEGTDASSLPAVATFLLCCLKARKHVEPFPLNELPWGPTQAFFDFKMRILNQSGPVVSTWGGKRKLVIETTEAMLIQHQMLDADGMEMDIRTYVLKEESGRKMTFTIAPPRAGKFKFMMFGMPKPKQKGHWRLPLLASFLVDCKLAKLLPPDPDPPLVPGQPVRRQGSEAETNQ